VCCGCDSEALTFKVNQFAGGRGGFLNGIVEG